MKLMSMTQEQELAGLRAEVERLRADQSKAIEKLAEVIGEGNDLKAKLAAVEADAAAMREALKHWRGYFQEDAPIGKDALETQAEKFTEFWYEAERALATGSGQRLLDELTALRNCVKDDCEVEDAARVEALKVLTELEVRGDSHGVPTVADIVERLVARVAHLRGMAQHMVACRALLNVPSNEVLHQAIQDLRETAKRRLDWLKKYESGERLTCPECGGIVSAPQRHTPDCRLGKDVATEDAK